MIIPKQILINLFTTHIQLSKSIRGGRLYCGKCPVCGDGDGNYSRRLYLLMDKEPCTIYCHNAGCAVSKGVRADRFFKIYFPMAYSLLGDVLMDAMQDNLYNTKPIKNIETIDDKKYSSNEFVEVVDFLKECTRLTDNFSSNIKDVRSYLIDERMIDTKLVNNLYYCEYPYTDEFIKFKGYIIIPFYNEFGIPNYFQCRLFDTAYDKQVRFLTSDFECCPKYSIYNEVNINPNKTVYILEGIIDALNVKNAMTICGVGISDDIIEYLEHKFNNVVWITDNDKAGEALAETLFKKGSTCFVWPKNINNLKDINDVCKKSKINYIPEQWIKLNTYTGTKGLWKLIQRKLK